MMKSHAWRFFADGARHPASAIRFRSSSDTGSDVYCRTLRRARIASQVSISSLSLRLWSGLFEGLERQRDLTLSPTMLPPPSSGSSAPTPKSLRLTHNRGVEPGDLAASHAGVDAVEHQRQRDRLGDTLEREIAVEPSSEAVGLPASRPAIKDVPAVQEIRLHDLRDTFATLQLSSGVHFMAGVEVAGRQSLYPDAGCLRRLHPRGGRWCGQRFARASRTRVAG